MAERPILFSAPMVRAILAGQKTQTRRVIKPQPELGESHHNWYPPNGAHLKRARHYAHEAHFREGFPIDFHRFGSPGDRLWVREAWLHIDDENDRFDGMGTQTYYRADQSERDEQWAAKRGLKWRPSIFMPRWASRITLEVTGVRVERLKEISEQDALAEGITGPHHVGYPAYRVPDDSKPRFSRASAAFEDLWCSINGAESWSADPWVWVVEFKRMETPS